MSEINTQDTVKDYYFTLIGDQFGHYVVIRGTFASARKEMFDRFGPHWGFQYGSPEEAGVEKFKLERLPDDSPGKLFNIDTDLPDPKEVGSREYAAIIEVIKSIVSHYPANQHRGVIRNTVDMFTAYASDIREAVGS